jgi:hypothetical protein
MWNSSLRQAYGVMKLKNIMCKQKIVCAKKGDIYTKVRMCRRSTNLSY